MNKIKDVLLPDESSFDESDFDVYSKKYLRRPIPIRCLRLQIPVHIPAFGGMIHGEAGDWLLEGADGNFFTCSDELFKSLYGAIE